MNNFSFFSVVWLARCAPSYHCRPIEGTWAFSGQLSSAFQRHNQNYFKTLHLHNEKSYEPWLKRVRLDLLLKTKVALRSYGNRGTQKRNYIPRRLWHRKSILGTTMTVAFNAFHGAAPWYARRRLSTTMSVARKLQITYNEGKVRFIGFP